MGLFFGLILSLLYFTTCFKTKSDTNSPCLGSPSINCSISSVLLGTSYGNFKLKQNIIIFTNILLCFSISYGFFFNSDNNLGNIPFNKSLLKTFISFFNSFVNFFISSWFVCFFFTSLYNKDIIFSISFLLYTEITNLLHFKLSDMILFCSGENTFSIRYFIYIKS